MILNAIRRYRLLAVLIALAAFSTGAQAAECGAPYTVGENDTLTDLAKATYGAADKWSLIFYANQKQFDNSTLLVPGRQIKIPCLKSPEEVRAQTAAARKQSRANAKIEVSRLGGQIQLLTAGDYRPFTDPSLPQGGMITDIIDTSLKTLREKASGPAYRISWVNDWSSHLNPLLVRKAFDMGFPWFKPNCERYDDLDKPARFRCDKFFFSKPVFEILVLFFTKKGSEFQFASDEEVEGKRLCRPSGYFTFDLDKDGRNWVKDDKVVLMRPQSVDECFRLLEKGEIDAVALNEFTGRAAVKKLGLGASITTIERPISVLSLHVVVAKTHPRARTFLHYVNSSLDRLRRTGNYDRIVDKHLSLFWSAQGSG